MFNYKFALSKLKAFENHREKLPDDFGCMYSLYPPETVNFFDFDAIGFIDKILNLIRRRFKKSDEDVEYYKNEGI